MTNEKGSYVLPNLALGPYRVEASLPGFRSFVQTGIVLQVNSSPVINVTLEVGQVSETVEVQANAVTTVPKSTQCWPSDQVLNAAVPKCRLILWVRREDA